MFETNKACLMAMYSVFIGFIGYELSAGRSNGERGISVVYIDSNSNGIPPAEEFNPNFVDSTNTALVPERFSCDYQTPLFGNDTLIENEPIDALNVDEDIEIKIILIDENDELMTFDNELNLSKDTEVIKEILQNNNPNNTNNPNNSKKSNNLKKKYKRFDPLKIQSLYDNLSGGPCDTWSSTLLGHCIYVIEKVSPKREMATPVDFVILDGPDSLRFNKHMMTEEMWEILTQELSFMAVSIVLVLIILLLLIKCFFVRINKKKEPNENNDNNINENDLNDDINIDLNDDIDIDLNNYIDNEEDINPIENESFFVFKEREISMKRKKELEKKSRRQEIMDAANEYYLEDLIEVNMSRCVVPEIGAVDGRFATYVGADEGTLAPQNVSMKKIKATALAEDLKKIAEYEVQNLIDNYDFETIRQEENIGSDTFTRVLESLPSGRNVNKHPHFHSSSLHFFPTHPQYEMIEKYVEDSEEIYEALDALWRKYGCTIEEDPESRRERERMERMKRREDRFEIELENMDGLSLEEKVDRLREMREEEEREEAEAEAEEKAEREREEEEEGDNYGAFRGEYMGMLTDGLSALKSLFVARKSLLVVREEYDMYAKALQCILENKELEIVMRCVHSVMSGLLGVREGTCIKYGSVPTVLGVMLVVDGAERRVLDVVMEKLGGVDLSSLAGLYETCLAAIRYDPLTLLSEFYQAKYSFEAGASDVKRMRKGEEKRALMRVCEVMNERLEETKEYRFGESKNRYDLGITMKGLADVNGKYGEDEVTKGCAVETVVSNTIEIIRALGVDVKPAK